MAIVFTNRPLTIRGYRLPPRQVVLTGTTGNMTTFAHERIGGTGVPSMSVAGIDEKPSISDLSVIHECISHPLTRPDRANLAGDFVELEPIKTHPENRDITGMERGRLS